MCLRGVGLGVDDGASIPTIMLLIEVQLSFMHVIQFKSLNIIHCNAKLCMLYGDLILA